MYFSDSIYLMDIIVNNVILPNKVFSYECNGKEVFKNQEGRRHLVVAERKTHKYTIIFQVNFNKGNYLIFI